MCVKSLRATLTLTCCSRSFFPQYPQSIIQMKAIKNGAQRASAPVSPSVVTAKPPSISLSQKNSQAQRQSFSQSGPVDTEVLKLRTPHSGFHLGGSERDYMEGWYWRVRFCSATLPCLRLTGNPRIEPLSRRDISLHGLQMRAWTGPSYDNTKHMQCSSATGCSLLLQHRLQCEQLFEFERKMDRQFSIFWHASCT